MSKSDTERSPKAAATSRVRYCTSSGGLSFDEFASFYGLEKGRVGLEGIDFEILLQAGGRPVMNQLLIDRKVDMGVISLSTAIRNYDEGLPLRVLGRETKFENGGGGVFAAASCNIKTPKDLPLAKKIHFHCEPDSERLVFERAIIEKKYGVKWSDLRLEEGA